MIKTAWQSSCHGNRPFSRMTAGTGKRVRFTGSICGFFGVLALLVGFFFVVAHRAWDFQQANRGVIFA